MSIRNAQEFLRSSRWADDRAAVCPPGGTLAHVHGAARVCCERVKGPEMDCFEWVSVAAEKKGTT